MCIRDRDSEILMLTKKGQAVRCEVTNIRETNRGSKGVKLIGLVDHDHLVGVSEVVKLDEDAENSIDLDESSSEEATESISESPETTIVKTSED